MYENCDVIYSSAVLGPQDTGYLSVPQACIAKLFASRHAWLVRVKKVNTHLLQRKN